MGKTRFKASLAVLTAVLFAALIQASAQAAKPGDLIPLSALDLPAGAIPASHSGLGGLGHSTPDLSSDGRYVAFTSMAESLAPGSHPDVLNIYRKDRTTGQVVLVSRANGANGTGVTSDAFSPKISNNGNRIAFVTDASLVPADTNDNPDIYVRDISQNTTVLATPGLPQGINVGYYESAFDLSGDGQWVVFSTIDPLTTGVPDSNDGADVYRRRLSDGATNLVSIRSDASSSANNDSVQPSISDNGRWVAFASTASDVIAGFTNGGDTNGFEVYVRDMNAAPAGSSRLVSSIDGSDTTGGNGNSDRPQIVSSAASLSQVKVAYGSYATNIDAPADPDDSTADSVYLRDFSLPGSYSILVSRLTGAGGANADSRAHIQSISADGKRIAFASDADNLRPGDGYYGIYVRDLNSNQTVFVGDNYQYTVAIGLAPNGNYAAWVSYGKVTADADPYLTSVYGRSLGTPITSLGTITHVSRPGGNAPYVAPMAPVNSDHIAGAHTLSADGRYVALVGVADRLAGLPVPVNLWVVMRKDVLTGKTIGVSLKNGANGEPVEGSEASISADGNLVVFTTRVGIDPADSNGLTDIYVRDIAANTTKLVSRANGVNGAVGNDTSSEGLISGDGRRVAFISEAGNLGGPGGTEHLFVRDLVSGETKLVDRASGEAGEIANSDVYEAAISDDGRKVAFTTNANNLHPDDPAVGLDLYVRDLSTNETTLESRRPGTGGAKLTGFTSDISISGDGRFVAFTTTDEQAVPGSGPWADDQVIRRELANGQNTLVSRVAGGGPAADDSNSYPILSGDGSKVSFITQANNLRPGANGGWMGVVSDLSKGGALSGPPPFGRLVNGQGVHRAEISRDGRCLGIHATGHNPLTGPLGDMSTAYMYVLEGDCHRPDPVASPQPKLSAVSLEPKKFAVGKKRTAKTASVSDAAAASKAKKGGKGKKRTPKGTTIRFRLNTKADVRIGFQRRVVGVKVRKSGKAGKGKVSCRPAPARVLRKTKAKKRCALWRPAGSIVRQKRPGGKLHKVAFSGRIGKKALKPGRYRAVLKARSEAGSSAPVRRPFRIVRP